jgi:DNA-binding response OmpR family regulator
MSQPGRSTVNILLVEDNRADVRLVEECLAEFDPAGFALQSAPRLSAALEVLAHQSFDLMLLDLLLPDSEGLETFRAIFSRFPFLPVVVVTALDDKDTALATLREGAQDYLVKGQITPESLGRSVEYAMERHRTLREELGSLCRLSAPAGTPVSATLYGQRDLKGGDPAAFAELAESYARVVSRSLEEQAYRVEPSAPDDLQQMAQRLGHLWAGPRDVIELHTAVLQSLSSGANIKKIQALVREGRMLVLRLMGYLASYYRYQSLGGRRAEAAGVRQPQAEGKA